MIFYETRDINFTEQTAFTVIFAKESRYATWFSCQVLLDRYKI